MRSALTWRNTLDSINFYPGVEKAGDTEYEWLLYLPFAPPCCSRSLIEHRHSLYIWEWCRKKWLFCPRALLCLGVRSSPLSYSFPACSPWPLVKGSSDTWAGLCTGLCFWDYCAVLCWLLTLQLHCSMSPLVLIYTLLCLSGYTHTSNQIKMQLRCG